MHPDKGCWRPREPLMGRLWGAWLAGYPRGAPLFPALPCPGSWVASLRDLLRSSTSRCPAGNSFVLQGWMSDPCRNRRLFSQTQKAVKSPQRELGMTPIAESLAGSSGGQLCFIKQLILLTDNSPPPSLNSYQAWRSSCLFIFWEWNYLPSFTLSLNPSICWKTEKKPEETQCLELTGNNKVFRGGTLGLVLTSSLPALWILISKSFSICTNCSTWALSSRFLFLPWPPMTTFGIWKILLFKN